MAAGGMGQDTGCRHEQNKETKQLQTLLGYSAQPQHLRLSALLLNSSDPISTLIYSLILLLHPRQQKGEVEPGSVSLTGAKARACQTY